MQWKHVPEKIEFLFQQNIKAATTARQYLGKLPPIDADVWVDGETDWAYLKVGYITTPEERVPWIKLARDLATNVGWGHEDPTASLHFVKVAYSKSLRTTLNTLNLTPGPNVFNLPSTPSPLAAMATGGLLGAGLGYGAGTLASTLMPETWNRKRIRKTLAALGGAMGASPGALWGALSLGNDKSLTSMWPYGPGDEIPTDSALEVKDIEVPRYLGKGAMTLEGLRDLNDKLGEVVGDTELVKLAQEFSTMGLLPPGSGSAIPVDAFNRVIWGDPRVTQRLDTPTQAAATAMVTSASRMGMPGFQQSPFVTPGQMGALAAGMGSGYLSGMLVGKALGTLMGMPTETQDTLKSTGMWAGAIKALVPSLF